MKTGLFFGSFNPIHKSHIAIANNKLLNTLINEVWFVITPENPFKKGKISTEYKDRKAMVDIAIQNHPKFFSCDIEFKLHPPYYTANTLRHLKEIYPNKDFLIIMGSDNYGDLINKKWKNSEYILKNFQICIYNRTKSVAISKTSTIHVNNIDPQKLCENIILPGEVLSTSSTLIRQKLKYNANNHLKSPVLMASSPLEFVDKKVLEYIYNHKLYMS